MATYIPAPFGALLRRYRLAGGLSQEGLAERAGLSAAAVAALESGRRTAPRPVTVALLADALGLSSDDRSTLAGAAAGGTELAAPVPAALAELAGSSSLTRPALPLPATALIGRESEEAAVAHLLREGRARLVTLIGPGGVGKTRLALAVAAGLHDAYPQGVVFVDLSPLHDPALVAPTVARALGLREDGGRSVRDLLLSFLSERKLLLVLDNVEQVVEAALLLAELVAACLRLAMPVTSRIALRVRAEQRFVVSPLMVPAGGHIGVTEAEACAAVRLFVLRARAVQPGFVLTPANAAAVAEICRRLDGLPLAIELAAARVLLLPPEALLHRLERRLSVLTRGASDMPERQQTLRATIDWSYQLLTPDEQTLFQRIAVFAGGGTLEAVETICDPDGTLDALSSVASLVDKSLLRIETRDETRVGMLETLREYAAERLTAAGEAARLGQAHAAYYLALAETAEPHLYGAEQTAWLMHLEDEHDNLRLALQWTLDRGDVEAGLRLGGALWRFWYRRGHISEGRRWLTRLLDHAGDDTSRGVALARARVLGGAGVFAELQGDYSDAVALHEESLAIRQSHGDTWGIADSLDDLGVVADSQGDVTRATTLYAQALALFQQLGDAWGTALVLGNMGWLTREQGACARAAALYEQSLILFRQVGDTRNIAFMLNQLGEVLCDQGECARATALCEESLALRRTLGDSWGLAISIASLGNVAQTQGAHARATELYEQSLALFRHLGATWNTACVLDSLSNVARKQGEYARAVALGKESLALFREIHDTKGMARALTSAARVAQAQGDLVGAERLCYESLALYRGIGAIFGAVPCLESLAHVLCAGEGGGMSAGRMEKGARLWGAVAALRETMGTPRSTVEQEAYDRAVATVHESLGARAFAAAWARGAALSLERAIAEAIADAPAP